MQTVTFKDWTLNRLDKAFNLKQVWQSELFDAWNAMPCEICDADKNSLLKLQAVLVRGGQYWNVALSC